MNERGRSMNAPRRTTIVVFAMLAVAAASATVFLPALADTTAMQTFSWNVAAGNTAIGSTRAR